MEIYWTVLDSSRGSLVAARYKGRMTSPTEVENTWEGTYELAAKARAA